MKRIVIPALLVLMLTLGAAGCTAENYLDPERNTGSGEGFTESASYGNVSTTHNVVVNGDNRNLVNYGERIAAEHAAGSR